VRTALIEKVVKCSALEHLLQASVKAAISIFYRIIKFATLLEEIKSGIQHFRDSKTIHLVGGTEHDNIGSVVDDAYIHQSDVYTISSTSSNSSI
jgi:hypothetical protein